jgi:hypothetical protein
MFRPANIGPLPCGKNAPQERESAINPYFIEHSVVSLERHGKCR